MWRVDLDPSHSPRQGETEPDRSPVIRRGPRPRSQVARGSRDSAFQGRTPDVHGPPWLGARAGRLGRVSTAVAGRRGRSRCVQDWSFPRPGSHRTRNPCWSHCRRAPVRAGTCRQRCPWSRQPAGWWRSRCPRFSHATGAIGPATAVGPSRGVCLRRSGQSERHQRSGPHQRDAGPPHVIGSSHFVPSFHAIWHPILDESRATASAGCHPCRDAARPPWTGRTDPAHRSMHVSRTSHLGAADTTAEPRWFRDARSSTSGPAGTTKPDPTRESGSVSGWS